jgi:alpha,alpha-trehalase
MMLHVDRRSALTALVVSCLSLSLPVAAFSTDQPAPPSVEFGELYHAVEMAGLFPDQKTFADAVPNKSPAEVMADYARQKELPAFDLKAFVNQHFALPRSFDVFRRHPDWNVKDYIKTMWLVLQREPDEIPPPDSSLLPLRRPYIVPGGRFRDIYYWDGYFTMLGLRTVGRVLREACLRILRR